MNNGLKISDEKTDVYIAEAIYQLQRNDQIYFTSTDKNYENLIRIASRLYLVGVDLEEEYRTKLSKPVIVNIDMAKKFIEEYNNCKKLNEIIVAERDVRIYIAKCIYGLQFNDIICLSSVDSYIDRQNYVRDSLSQSIGVETDKQSENKHGRLEIKKCKTTLFDEQGGRGREIVVNKIYIRKPNDIEIKDIRIYYNGYIMKLDKKYTYLLDIGDAKELIDKIVVDEKVNPKEEILDSYHDEKSGRVSKLKLKKIGLTKIPDLYRFTRLE